MRCLLDTPVLVGSFDLETRTLLWAQMRLYTGRLVLLCWEGLRFRRRSVPLRQIERVERSAPDGLRLALDDETLRVRVEDPARWRDAIRAHRDVQDGGASAAHR